MRVSELRQYSKRDWHAVCLGLWGAGGIQAPLLHSRILSVVSCFWTNVSHSCEGEQIQERICVTILVVSLSLLFWKWLLMGRWIVLREDEKFFPFYYTYFCTGNSTPPRPNTHPGAMYSLVSFIKFKNWQNFLTTK